jgi:hypothetical protein
MTVRVMAPDRRLTRSMPVGALAFATYTFWSVAVIECASGPTFHLRLIFSEWGSTSSSSPFLRERAYTHEDERAMSSIGSRTTIVEFAAGSESLTRPEDEADQTAPSPASSGGPSIGTLVDERTRSR